MASETDNKRIDTASRVIAASPETIYSAFLSPEAIAVWRPPEGMVCHIYSFDAHQGGTYRMSFGYKDIHHDVPGKTSAHEDVFTGRFVELLPNKRLVEEVTFESDDPAFAGTMTITTMLTPVASGTEVTFLCEHVPAGIQPGDHYKGMTSTLENLAKFCLNRDL